MEKWRDDGMFPSELPSVSSVVRCAEDVVASGSIFVAYVAHVKTFHGNGFMPSVRSFGSICNGDVHLGTSDQIYQAAVRNSHEMLKKEVESLNAALGLVRGKN